MNWECCTSEGNALISQPAADSFPQGGSLSGKCGTVDVDRKGDGWLRRLGTFQFGIVVFGIRISKNSLPHWAYFAAFRPLGGGFVRPFGNPSSAFGGWKIMFWMLFRYSVGIHIIRSIPLVRPYVSLRGATGDEAIRFPRFPAPAFPLRGRCLVRGG